MEKDLCDMIQAVVEHQVRAMDALSAMLAACEGDSGKGCKAVLDQARALDPARMSKDIADVMGACIRAVTR